GSALCCTPIRVKTGGGPCVASDLQSDAGIARLQRAIAPPRPISPHRIVEFVAAAGINRIIDRLDPFDIGTKPRLPSEIERDMHPEPARHRHGIDKPSKRRLAAQREINSAPELGRLDTLARLTIARTCLGRRIKTITDYM